MIYDPLTHLGGQPKGKIFLLLSQDVSVDEMSTAMHSGPEIRLTVSGDGAQDLLMQIAGEPSQFSHNPDEEYVARAKKAEQHAEAWKEQVADYEGEIEHLNAKITELEEKIKRSKFATGGIVGPSPINVVSPVVPPGPLSGADIADLVRVYSEHGPAREVSRMFTKINQDLKTLNEKYDPFTHGDIL